MNLTAVAAIAYLVATAGVIAFQVALALGAPWGAYAMGGSNPGKFPPKLRAAALVQAVLLGFLAVVALSHAGLALVSLSEAIPPLIWAVVAFSAISVVLNSISRSPGERRIWVPVGLVLLVCSLAVAITAG